MTRPTESGAVHDLFGDQSQSRAERLAAVLREWDAPDEAVVAVLTALQFPVPRRRHQPSIEDGACSGSEGPTTQGRHGRSR